MKKVFDSIEDRSGGGNLDVPTQEIGALSCVVYIQELGGVLTILNKLRSADALTSMYILGVHGGSGNGKQTVGFNIFAQTIRFSFTIAATNDLRIIMFDEPIKPFGSWVLASANPNIGAGANTTPFTNMAIGAYSAISVHVSSLDTGLTETTVNRAGLGVLSVQESVINSGLSLTQPPHIITQGVTFTLLIRNSGGAAGNFPTHIVGYF